MKTSVYKAPIKIRRKDVVRLIESPLVLSAWREWGRYRRFGLAHGRGWRDERPRYVRAMEALEQELDDWMSEQRKNHGGR